MKKISFKVEQADDDVMISISGKDLTINFNTFFGVNSVIAFIPKELIMDMSIQLGQIAEDIERSKELKDGKASEELREMTPLEKEVE